MNKRVPVLYNNKYECCGCTACYSICPILAIEMIYDEEGFEYPIINEEKCIECNRCLSVCSFKKEQKNKEIFFDE